MITEATTSPKAQWTDAAKNCTKQTQLLQVVRVPRKVFAKHWHGAVWADLLAAAERGDDGLSVWIVVNVKDRPAANEAFLRECDRSPMLGGRACLYAQGWTAEAA